MDGFAASFVVQHFCAARRASATVRVRHSDVQISPVGFWIEPLSQSRNGVAAAGCSPVCSLLCVRENGWGGGHVLALCVVRRRSLVVLKAGAALTRCQQTLFCVCFTGRLQLFVRFLTTKGWADCCGG
jgi:hypothetical protein